MSDVVMPQMGESIAEGTIVRWIKKVGDRVDRDEPLFEISTDKVDAEIPSPSAGVIVEIRAKEGETVPVNSVVAVIGEAGAAVAAPAAKAERSRARPARARAAGPARRTRGASPGGRCAGRCDAGARHRRPASSGRVGERGGGAEAEVVAAGAENREGTPRRPVARARHRARRPRHEGRHPRLSERRPRPAAPKRPRTCPRRRSRPRTSPHSSRATTSKSCRCR